MSIWIDSKYDSIFLLHPLRDLIPIDAHFYPKGLAEVVATQAAIVGLPKLAKELYRLHNADDSRVTVAKVKSDPLMLCRWIVRPVLRVMAIISTMRALERTIIYSSREEIAGRFIRCELSVCSPYESTFDIKSLILQCY